MNSLDFKHLISFSNNLKFQKPSSFSLIAALIVCHASTLPSVLVSFKNFFFNKVWIKTPEFFSFFNHFIFGKMRNITIGFFDALACKSIICSEKNLKNKVIFIKLYERNGILIRFICYYLLIIGKFSANLWFILSACSIFRCDANSLFMMFCNWATRVLGTRSGLGLRCTGGGGGCGFGLVLLAQALPIFWSESNFFWVG